MDDEELDRTTDVRSLRPEDIYEHRVQSGEVRDCVQSLPEKYREVVLLRCQEELSYEQIAEILEVPVTNR